MTAKLAPRLSALVARPHTQYLPMRRFDRQQCLAAVSRLAGLAYAPHWLRSPGTPNVREVDRRETEDWSRAVAAWLCSSRLDRGSDREVRSACAPAPLAIGYLPSAFLPSYRASCGH